MGLYEVIYLLFVLVINAGAAYSWIYWLSYKDAYAVQKGQRHTVLIFFLGGLISAPLSLLLYWFNGLSDSYYAGIFQTVIYMFLVVGLCEESSKLLTFLTIARIRKSLKEPLDPIIQGASVGLGFAVMENFIYALEYDLEILLIRSVLTISGHMAYTAIAAFMYGASKYWNVRGMLGRLLPFTGLATAVILHGSYNSINTYSYSMAGPIFFDVLVFVILIMLFNRMDMLSPYRAFKPEAWKEAIKAIDTGLSYDTSNPDLAARRGWYHLCGGEYEEAIVDYDRASGLAPQSHIIKAYLGVSKSLAEPGDMYYQELEDAFACMTRRQHLRFRVRMAQSLGGKNSKRILADIDFCMERIKEFPLISKRKKTIS